MDMKKVLYYSNKLDQDLEYHKHMHIVALRRLPSHHQSNITWCTNIIPFLIAQSMLKHTEGPVKIWVSDFTKIFHTHAHSRTKSMNVVQTCWCTRRRSSMFVANSLQASTSGVRPAVFNVLSTVLQYL
jgi:hypothetical protein